MKFRGTTLSGHYRSKFWRREKLNRGLHAGGCCLCPLTFAHRFHRLAWSLFRPLPGREGGGGGGGTVLGTVRFRVLLARLEVGPLGGEDEFAADTPLVS